MAAVEFAELRRRRAGDVDLFAGRGAVGRGEFEGFGIDGDGLDAGGRLEIFNVFVGRQRGCLLYTSPSPRDS